jgi:hypothetical protein
VYVYAPSPPLCRPPAGRRPQAITYRRLTTRYRKRDSRGGAQSPYIPAKQIDPKKYIHQTRRRQKLATQRMSVDTFSNMHLTETANTICSTQTTLCAKLLFSSPLRRSRRLEVCQIYSTPNTQETSHLVPQRISYATYSIKLC